MDVEKQMDTEEMVRLTRWLKARGHNDAEVLACIRYIAGEKENEPADNEREVPAERKHMDV